MPAWTVRTISYHPPHGTPSFMAFPTYKPSHSCGFYDKFCFMPINPFIHFPMAHRWSDRFFSGNLLMLLVSSAQLPALHKSLGSPPKNRALPRSSSTSNNSSSSSSKPSSRPWQSLPKTSPGWVLTGCNFNEVRTRCKRGPNEVRNHILGDWPPKSPDKLFGSHMLVHSFQNSKAQELSAVEHGGAEEETKPSSSCRQEQGDRRGDKGRVRETDGRQRDASLANKAAVTNLSGHRLFETYCRNRDSQVSIVCLCKVPINASVS